MNIFIDLLKKDQKNINLFKNKKRSLGEFKKIKVEISGNFLKMVNRHGFPYKDTAPKDEYRAGIVLSLHLNLNQLKKIFSNMENADSTKIDLSDKAYIIDKIRVLDGKKQLYGTQFKYDNGSRVIFLPIENKKLVNKRRGALGLCTLVEYIKFIKGKRSSALKTDE